MTAVVFPHGGREVHENVCPSSVNCLSRDYYSKSTTQITFTTLLPFMVTTPSQNNHKASRQAGNQCQSSGLRQAAPHEHTSSLREVGVPSRNILHVRGRGSKSRFCVADGFAGRAPKTYFKKSKVVEVRPILASSGTPLFWVRACELNA